MTKVSIVRPGDGEVVLTAYPESLCYGKVEIEHA